MPESYDFIIAGAGLAGACAAFSLGTTHSVLLLDTRTPASGASGISAGLANPLMARRARPVWQHDAALRALHQMLALTGASSLFQGPAILRPAVDAKQVDFFQDAARAHPMHASWWSHGALREAYPAVRTPHGGLLVHTGGAVEIPRMVKAVIAEACRQGATFRPHHRVTHWSTEAGSVTVRVETEVGACEVRGGRLILALGSGSRHLRALQSMNLHYVKGQTVHLPPFLEPAFVDYPHLAGRGYVVFAPDRTVVGSSYEHSFSDDAPSSIQTGRILSKASSMLPALSSAPIQETQAGIRVNVPGTRLPMLGPLPGQPHVWVFTGLGSKGLLLAPLLALRLLGYIKDPASIPLEIRVQSDEP